MSGARVRMCHPDMDGVVIEVAEGGVPFRRAAGWVLAPDPEPPAPEAEPEPAAPRRRRTSKED